MFVNRGAEVCEGMWVEEAKSAATAEKCEGLLRCVALLRWSRIGSLSLASRRCLQLLEKRTSASCVGTKIKCLQHLNHQSAHSVDLAADNVMTGAVSVAYATAQGEGTRGRNWQYSREDESRS